MKRTFQYAINPLTFPFISELCGKETIVALVNITETKSEQFYLVCMHLFERERALNGINGNGVGFKSLPQADSHDFTILPHCKKVL